MIVHVPCPSSKSKTTADGRPGFAAAVKVIGLALRINGRLGYSGWLLLRAAVGHLSTGIAATFLNGYVAAGHQTHAALNATCSASFVRQGGWKVVVSTR
jgi:hypothetical protein